MHLCHAHPTYIFLAAIAVWSIRTPAHASEHVIRHDTLRSLGKQRFTVEIIAVSSIGQWARYAATRIGHGFDLISAWSAPSNWARPSILPSQSDFEACGLGGTSSATGSPKRVIRTGLPVRFTRWRTARQVALNRETEMVSIGLAMFNLCGQLTCSPFPGVAPLPQFHE